uniref:Zingipain-2-like n=1 Tax=Cicer arietinum TaxID=3827 RepID=A0A1S3DWS7_CICAR|nr:zingipain-2-like [Cicer arietinum]
MTSIQTSTSGIRLLLLVMEQKMVAYPYHALPLGHLFECEFPYFNFIHFTSCLRWGYCPGCAIPLNSIELFNLDTLALLSNMNGSIPSNIEKIQQLVDCDDLNHGCKYGKISTAFEYIIKNKGLVKGEEYPYEAVKGTCRRSEFESHGPISSYHRVVLSESYLQQAVAKQPVSAALGFTSESTISFANYKGGIFEGPCLVDKHDIYSNKYKWHSITIVGYGTEDGTKNSWGLDWGENGYMRMKMHGGGSIWVSVPFHCKLFTPQLIASYFLFRTSLYLPMLLEFTLHFSIS